MASYPPAWYPDPEDPSRWRWWDGEAWTSHTAAPEDAAPPDDAQRAPVGSRDTEPAPGVSEDRVSAPGPTPDATAAPFPPPVAAGVGTSGGRLSASTLRRLVVVGVLLVVWLIGGVLWLVASGWNDQDAVTAPPFSSPTPVSRRSPFPSPAPEDASPPTDLRSVDWTDLTWLTDCTEDWEDQEVTLELAGWPEDDPPVLVTAQDGPVRLTVNLDSVAYGDVTGEGLEGAAFQTVCAHDGFETQRVEVWTLSGHGHPTQLPVLLEYTEMVGIVAEVEIVDGAVRVITNETAPGNGATHLDGYPVEVVTDWSWDGRGWVPREVSRTPDDPVLPDPAEVDGDPTGAAIAFFRSTEGACVQHAADTGNPEVEPERFDGAEVRDVLAGDPDIVHIIDGVGTDLFVVPAWGQIWGGPSPHDVMPFPYSFGCPAHIYVGSLGH